MLIVNPNIPFSRLVQESPGEVTNPGIITVRSTGSQILTVPLTRATQGSVFLLSYSWRVIKGAIAGSTEIIIHGEPIGPGNLVLTRDYKWFDPLLPIGEDITRSGSFIVEIASVGDPNAGIELFGTSLGSDSTVPIGDAWFKTIQLYK